MKFIVSIMLVLCTACGSTQRHNQLQTYSLLIETPSGTISTVTVMTQDEYDNLIALYPHSIPQEYFAKK